MVTSKYPREEPRRHIEQALEWLETYAADNGNPYLVTEGIGSLNHALVALAHNARSAEAIRSYAERSLGLEHGEKTEDELLQRIWNLANDVLKLTARSPQRSLTDGGEADVALIRESLISMQNMPEALHEFDRLVEQTSERAEEAERLREALQAEERDLRDQIRTTRSDRMVALLEARRTGVAFAIGRATPEPRRDADSGDGP